MRTSTIPTFVLFTALIGCEKPAIHALEDRIDSLETTAEDDQLSALSDRVDELDEALSNALADITTLQEALDAVESGQVTEEWVEEQDAAIAADVAANALAIDDLADRVAAIEADYLTSDDLTGLATETWVSDQGYASAADVAAIEADYLTSDDLTGLATETWVSDQGYASAADVAAIEADYVSESDLAATTLSASETWTVGPSSSADYADLHDALDAANLLHIHPDAYLVLQLETGTHSYTDIVRVRHPNGRNILIRGDRSDPSSVVLDFSGEDASYGIYVDSASELGELSGLTLSGDGVDSDAGIYAVRNSYVLLMDVVVEGWASVGVYANSSSVIEVNEGGLEVSGSSYGVLAQHQSLIVAPYMWGYDNEIAAMAQFGSTLNAYGSVFEGNGYGAYINWGSTGMLRDATADSNTYAGFLAVYGSVNHVSGTSADGNNIGYQTDASSMSYAPDVLSTNNEYGFWSGYLSLTDASAASVSGNSYDYSPSSLNSSTTGAIIIAP